MLFRMNQRKYPAEGWTSAGIGRGDTSGEMMLALNREPPSTARAGCRAMERTVRQQLRGGAKRKMVEALTRTLRGKTLEARARIRSRRP